MTLALVTSQQVVVAAEGAEGEGEASRGYPEAAGPGEVEVEAEAEEGAGAGAVEGSLANQVPQVTLVNCGGAKVRPQTPLKHPSRQFCSTTAQQVNQEQIPPTWARSPQ